MDSSEESSGNNRQESPGGPLKRRKVLGEMNTQDISSNPTSDKVRRGFLKGAISTLGVVVASTLGISKPAVGRESINEEALMAAARKYHSEEKVQEQIRNHDGLLTSLANHGHLDSPSVSELPVNKLYGSHEKYSAAEEGMIVFGLPQDGEPRAKIEIKKQTSDGNRLVMRIEPERNYSFVLVKSKPDEVVFGRKSSSDGVSILGCSLGGVEKYCEVFCGPYSCTCYIYNYCPDCMDCSCHTHEESCSSCDDAGC